MTGAIKIFAPGIDAYQRRAREGAGIETRTPAPKVTQKLVHPLVTVECVGCGCTNAWPADAKKSAKVCGFCGAQHKATAWDAPMDRISGGQL